jgi:hypothetical protein
MVSNCDRHDSIKAIEVCGDFRSPAFAMVNPSDVCTKPWGYEGIARCCQPIVCSLISCCLDRRRDQNPHRVRCGCAFTANQDIWHESFISPFIFILHHKVPIFCYSVTSDKMFHDRRWNMPWAIFLLFIQLITMLTILGVLAKNWNDIGGKSGSFPTSHS